MLRKISLARTALLLLTGLLAASCTKNTATTIVPIGSETYIIDEILNEVADSAFWADFGPVNRGPVPPNLEGFYLVAPNVRTSTNIAGLPVGSVEPNATLRISKQHNGIAIMELNENIDNVTDTVFVMGNGNAFTIYFIEEKHYEVPYETVTFHANMKRFIVMTGSVTDEGLSGFRMASIIMEATDDSNGVMQQDVPGSYFIYKDGDGLAERMEEP